MDLAVIDRPAGGGTVHPHRAGAGSWCQDRPAPRPRAKQTLSNLLVNLVVPAMIINSYRMEFSAEILHNLHGRVRPEHPVHPAGHSSSPCCSRPAAGTAGPPIFRFACVFSNAGYMGLPLISALFGSEGLLYASAYLYHVQSPALDGGLQHGQRQLRPQSRGAEPGRTTPAIYAVVVGLAIYLLQIPHALPCMAQPIAPAGRHEHPSFHAHHRYADRGGRPAAHRLQPTSTSGSWPPCGCWSFRPC